MSIICLQSGKEKCYIEDTHVHVFADLFVFAVVYILISQKQRQALLCHYCNP